MNDRAMNSLQGHPITFIPSLGLTHRPNQGVSGAKRLEREAASLISM